VGTLFIGKAAEDIALPLQCPNVEGSNAFKSFNMIEKAASFLGLDHCDKELRNDY
jgi:hypothetical protein